MTTEDKIREIYDCFRIIGGASRHHDKKQSRLFSNFSHQEFHAMMFIGGIGSCRMSDIAENMQLSLSSITAIVDKLVAKKMVKRIHSTEDRRIVQVALTDEASRIYTDAMNQHLNLLRNILSPLNSHEQDVFLSLFKKIAVSLKERRIEG